MLMKLNKNLKIVFLLSFLCHVIAVGAQDSNPKIIHSKGKLLGKSAPLVTWKYESEKFAESMSKKLEWKKSIKEIPNFPNAGTAKRDFSDFILPKNGDPLAKIQSKLAGNKSLLDEIDIIKDFDGIDFSEGGIWPPDCNGDIGLNYYMMGTNGSGGSILHIYDKITGELIESTTTNALWANLNTSPVGDIIVFYDRLENRWVISEITFNSILIAVSETSDPLGSYNAYEFIQNGLPDYPKFGNWPDAYYATTNEFEGSNPIYAFDKQDLINGEATIDVIKFEIIPKWNNGSIETNTPLDFSGTMLPNAGTNFMAVRIYDDEWGVSGSDRIEFYEFTPNFDDPSASIFSGPMDFETAPFESSVCGYGLFDCLEQPNGSLVSAIHTIVMNKVQYRNFSNYESILLNFTVDVNGNDRAGVRWIEMRKSLGGEWELYQEGTLTNADNISRFMGTLTQDSKGNILLGYAMVSPDKFLSVGLTGRRANDPLGMMSFAETVLVEGKKNNPVSRWGDYFSITVDPQNDESFWLTSEYMPQTANLDWSTRLTEMKIRRDSIDATVSLLIEPVSADDLTSAEQVTIQITNPGFLAIENVPYGFIFEGNIIETGIVEEVIEPLQSVQRTFTNTIDLGTIGVYNLKAYTFLEGDENVNNDTLRAFISKKAMLDVATSANSGNNPSFSCSDLTDFQAIYKNEGTQEIISFDAELYINDILTVTVPYDGSLLTNESVKIDFIGVSLPVGNSTIKFSVSNPNGEIDEVAENNDDEIEFSKLEDGIQVNLSFMSDGFPFETSWEIVDVNDQVVYSGNGYNGYVAEENIDLCFDEACYTFRLFDGFGDGWGGSQTAFLEIVQEDGVKAVVLDNTSFGSVWEAEFCLPVSCDLQAEVEYEDASSPGKNDAAIYVNFPLADELTTYSIDGGFTFQSSPLFTNLVDGPYTVIIKDKFGCTFTQEVNILVGIDDSESEYEFMINPNPNFGMMKVSLTGYNGPSELRATIIDQNGRKVGSHRIGKFSNGYHATIFEPNLIPGFYYMIVENDDFKEMRSFIKQ